MTLARLSAVISNMDQSYSLRIVDVEEVRVQDRLDDTCNDCDWVEVIVEEVPVYPVGNVKGTIDPQSEEVVGCDVLCLTCPLQHEELRENGD